VLPRAALSACVVVLLGCEARPSLEPSHGGSPAGPGSAESGAASTPATSALAPAPDESARARDGARALAPAEWRGLVATLSEEGGAFPSDNYVSNETSQLHVAAAVLRRVRPGGVYLGVGPEQNFAYVALSRPALAFVLDIRRDNLVLHLLYKAAFELAADRAELVALLLGRGRPVPVAAEAPLDAVLETVAASSRSTETLEAAHRRIVERLDAHGALARPADREALGRIHRAFFRHGLDLRFAWREASFRRYPPLGEMLGVRDAEGRARGFAADEETFRLVQRMQREHRIVPVVADFAGDRALAAIAAELDRRRLRVGVFYVSNVEQYLLEGGVWWKWRRNVALLPVDDASVFVRAYLDQGKPHPRQRPGHRTTTTLHPVADLLAERASPRSMLELATRAILE
jgi:hypothetical protein